MEHLPQIVTDNAVSKDNMQHQGDRARYVGKDGDDTTDLLVHVAEKHRQLETSECEADDKHREVPIIVENGDIAEIRCSLLE